MTRLVDFHFEQINATYDALPIRKKLAFICHQFDAWVRGNGAVKCVACDATVTSPTAVCDTCAIKEQIK